MFGKKRLEKLLKEKDKSIAELRNLLSKKEQDYDTIAKQLAEAKKSSDSVNYGKDGFDSTYRSASRLQKAITDAVNNSINKHEEVQNDSRNNAQKAIIAEIFDRKDAEKKEINDNEINFQSNEPQYLQSLNEEQLEAVKSTEGYVRVIAGAGSGKTRALINRYVHLVEGLGISPANILCVTFTNKAAKEMKNRVRQMIGDKDLALICTFHGFCVQVLRADAPKINYPKNFLVLDDEDIETILKKIYEENNISLRDFTFNIAKDMISGFKHNAYEEYIECLMDPDLHILSDRYSEAKEIDKKIIWGYLYEQRKNFGFDYDDLMLSTLYILKHFSDVRVKWQEKLEYIMVDEFQDVNDIQFLLCDILQERHKNLFVVGDPDQTIYTFRGADIRLILNFDKTYMGTKTIIMAKNYRSSPNIVDVANSLIAHNKTRMEKRLIPTKNSNIRTIYNHAKTIQEEAEFIAKTIDEARKRNIELGRFAVLYRSHYVSRAIEEALMKHKLPYKIYSGISFYERKEIKDVLSYLRMILYQDDISLLRTINEPRRNIGKTRIDRIKQYADANKCTLYQALQQLIDSGDSLLARSEGADYVAMIEKYRSSYNQYKLTDLLESVMRDSGYEKMVQTVGEEERLENIAELKQSMVDYEDNVQEELSLEDFLSRIALLTNIDKEEKGNTIKLMTVHSAKGLEFPYVFLCGLNEGIFPSIKTDSLPKMEEERRLAYVACTRAQTALFLSDAEGMNYDHSFRYPSRFIFEIKKDLLVFLHELDKSIVMNAKKQIQQTDMRFQDKDKQSKKDVGTIIEHEVFKRGKIIKADIANDTYEVKFDNGQIRHLTTVGINNCKIVPPQ